MVVPQAPEQIEAVKHLVPVQYLHSAHLAELREELLEEIQQDYLYSLKKAIGQLLPLSVSVCRITCTASKRP